MSETLCTCTDPNCIDAHDCEPAPCVYEMWYTGEKAETLAFADNPQEVIAEINNFTKNAPEDFPGWKIRNRVEKKTVAAPAFFTQWA